MRARRVVFPAGWLLTKDQRKAEQSRLLNAGNTDGWQAYRQVAEREGTKDQVEAWQAIAGGTGTFRYRCGGLRGPVHRVVVRPTGEWSFPDHTDGGVGAVLAVLAGQKTAPTCADVSAVLRSTVAGSDRAKNMVALWNGTLSDCPGWAQALVAVMERTANIRGALRAQRAQRTTETSLQNRAAAEIAADAGVLKALGVRVVAWAKVPSGTYHGTAEFESRGSVMDSEAVVLPWPDGYEAYQVTRLGVTHGAHRDFCPVVRPGPGGEPFREPRTYAALIVCCRGRDKPLEGPTLPAVIGRKGSGWAVLE